MPAVVIKELCQGCGVCTQVCENKAIFMQANMAWVDPLRCRDCEECIFTCPIGAIIQAGEEPVKDNYNEGFNQEEGVK